MAAKRSTSRAAVVMTAIALSLALAACGSGSSSTASRAPTARRVSLAISNYAYHPGSITVAPGTTVTFINHDQTAHTATSTGPGFDTGTLKPGQAATVHLDKPGSYTYYCQFHALMRGTIVVK
jgi:plastocyanin